MSRTNIFELLEQNNSFKADVQRIQELCRKYYFVRSGAKSWLLIEFVDEICFLDWKGRHKCIDLDDFFRSIKLEDLRFAAQFHLDEYLTYIELIYNLWHLATKHIDSHPNEYEYYQTVDTLADLLETCLSEVNQAAYYDEESETCMIAEASPSVTAAAEISDPATALEIIRYNHRSLKGDLQKKRMILIALGDSLEGRKKEIMQYNAALYKTITAGLNNLNIRHNNISPQNLSTYHKAVAEMAEEELEGHYDDLYQLILHAILLIDNVERQRNMSELIKRISGNSATNTMEASQPQQEGKLE